MNPIHLLTVEERFQLSGIGLRLAPDFSVPKGRWRDLQQGVLLVTPDGHEFEELAHFGMAHFNIRDPEAPVSMRWRIVITLPSAQKENVPIGSRLFVSPEIASAVRGAEA